MKYRRCSTAFISIALVGFFTVAALPAFAQETKNRTFTPKELSLYNGTNGRPAYVAVEGKVYDVSKSRFWENGHHEIHHSGLDLSDELRRAPHGKEVLRNMAEVGVLLKTEKDRLPTFVETLLERYPVFRRHPHPFFVHFPLVFLVGGAVFILLYLCRPKVAPFEQAAFMMLIMGIISTPPAIVTGLWNWWVAFSLQPTPQVFYKISLSIILVLVEITCLLIRMRRPFEKSIRGWVYLSLMLFLAVDVLAIGFLGGQLTYGY
jgi:predicted heme/steroid binding protein/uncharacterized membrane protein